MYLWGPWAPEGLPSSQCFPHGCTPGLVPFHDLHGLGLSHPSVGFVTSILLPPWLHKWQLTLASGYFAQGSWGRACHGHHTLSKLSKSTRSAAGWRFMALWAPTPLLYSHTYPRRLATPTAKAESCHKIQDFGFSSIQLSGSPSVMKIIPKLRAFPLFMELLWLGPCFTLQSPCQGYSWA